MGMTSSLPMGMTMDPALGWAQAGVSAGTGIFSLIMQYQAIQKQIEESRRVETIQTKQWEKTFDLNKSLGLGGLALQKRQQLFAEQKSKQEAEVAQEETGYKRVQDFKNGLLDAVNSNLNYRNRLISMWR